jgi:hypothetical protein
MRATCTVRGILLDRRALILFGKDNLLRSCEISGSHGGKYEDDSPQQALCSLFEVYRRFSSAYCLHYQTNLLQRDYTALYTSTLSTSNYAVYYYEIFSLNEIPEINNRSYKIRQSEK